MPYHLESVRATRVKTADVASEIHRCVVINHGVDSRECFSLVVFHIDVRIEEVVPDKRNTRYFLRKIINNKFTGSCNRKSVCTIVIDIMIEIFT